MRISDWSSDVCSSDLALLQPDLLGHDLVHGQGRSQGAAAGVRQLQKLQRALQSTVFAMASVQGNENTVKAGTDQIDQCVAAGVEQVGIHTGAAQGQLGRASGRERVGKYV